MCREHLPREILSWHKVSQKYGAPHFLPLARVQQTENRKNEILTMCSIQQSEGQHETGDVSCWLELVTITTHHSILSMNI